MADNGGPVASVANPSAVASTSATAASPSAAAASPSPAAEQWRIGAAHTVALLLTIEPARAWATAPPTEQAFVDLFATRHTPGTAPARNARKSERPPTKLPPLLMGLPALPPTRADANPHRRVNTPAFDAPAASDGPLPCGYNLGCGLLRVGSSTAADGVAGGGGGGGGVSAVNAMSVARATASFFADPTAVHHSPPLQAAIRASAALGPVCPPSLVPWYCTTLAQHEAVLDACATAPPWPAATAAEAGQTKDTIAIPPASVQPPEPERRVDLLQLLTVCRAEAAAGNAYAINNLGWLTLFGVGQEFEECYGAGPGTDTVVATTAALALAASVSEPDASYQYTTDCAASDRPDGDPRGLGCDDVDGGAADAATGGSDGWECHPYDASANAAEAYPLFVLAAAKGCAVAQQNVAVLHAMGLAPLPSAPVPSASAAAAAVGVDSAFDDESIRCRRERCVVDDASADVASARVKFLQYSIAETDAALARAHRLAGIAAPAKLAPSAEGPTDRLAVCVEALCSPTPTTVAAVNDRSQGVDALARLSQSQLPLEPTVAAAVSAGPSKLRRADRDSKTPSVAAPPPVTPAAIDADRASHWALLNVARAAFYGCGGLPASGDASVALLRDHPRLASLSVAQRSLYYCYVAGFGVAEDESRAAQTIMRACAGGDATAAQFVAGHHNSQDPTKFLTAKAAGALWLERCARAHNDPLAQYELGCAFGGDGGVPHMSAWSLFWTRMAAHNHCGEALLAQARIYRDGVRPTASDAAHHRQGNDVTGGFLVPPDFRRSLRWLRRAAQSRWSVAAMAELARFHRYGLGGARKCSRLGFEWTQRALLAAALSDEPDEGVRLTVVLAECHLKGDGPGAQYHDYIFRGGARGGTQRHLLRGLELLRLAHTRGARKLQATFRRLSTSAQAVAQRDAQRAAEEAATAAYSRSVLAWWTACQRYLLSEGGSGSGQTVRG